MIRKTQRKRKKGNTSRAARQWLAFAQAMNLLSHHIFGFLVLTTFVSLLLSLPLTVLYVSYSISGIEKAINKNAQMTIYLQPHLPAQQTEALIRVIEQRHDIQAIDYISPEEGLKEFEAQSGFDQLKTYLPENPLPGVILAQTTDTNTMKTTVDEISQIAGIDNVAINSQWLDHSLQFIQAVEHSLLISTAVTFFLILVIIVMLFNLLLPESLADTSKSTMVHMGMMLGIITGIGADFAVDYFSRFVHALLSQLAFLNIAPNHLDMTVLGILINQSLSWAVLIVAALIVRHYRLITRNSRKTSL